MDWVVWQRVSLTVWRRWIYPLGATVFVTRMECLSNIFPMTVGSSRLQIIGYLLAILGKSNAWIFSTLYAFMGRFIMCRYDIIFDQLLWCVCIWYVMVRMFRFVAVYFTLLLCCVRLLLFDYVLYVRICHATFDRLTCLDFSVGSAIMPIQAWSTSSVTVCS